MEESVVIRVKNLSKAYRIGLSEQRHDTLGSVIAGWLKSPFQNYKRLRNLSRINEEGDTSDIYWAVKNVSFQVRKGEVLGVIGKNGAGKSTLLKILSQITDPTEGEAEINGRVASLLEVGTGFNPELTGRENVFLNGTILGMTKAEINSKFAEIVEFSGVEKFIDTPVKRYSSGMKVRLAFAVAAHLDPEILIIDEVLAVGDSEFQNKCLGKIKSVAGSSGRTVLFVSHNMSAVENLCDNAILLEHGQVTKSGTAMEVIKYYQSTIGNKNTNRWKLEEARNSPAYFTDLALELKSVQPSLKLEITCSMESNRDHNEAFIAFDIVNSLGLTIMQAIPNVNPFIKWSKNPQQFTFEIDLPPLIPDIYKVSVWMGEHFTRTLSWEKEVIGFEVDKSPTLGRIAPHSYSNGFLVPESRLLKSN